MKQFYKWFWTVFVLTVTPLIVYAQAADCPSIVKNALDETDQACSTTGRNQACYGNVSLTAEAQANVPAFTFTKPGDLVEIAGVKNLILSPLDAASDTWGVALLKIQANLPETLPGQNVTLILFDDVEINNAAIKDQTPMQAFYFKSGLNEAPCEQASHSGILIQTHADQRKIELTVDEVQITLGSSAYLQAQPGGELTVTVIQGESTITNPEPNTYIINATIQNGTIHQEYHLLNDSQIEGEITLTVKRRGTCTLTTSFRMRPS